MTHEGENPRDDGPSGEANPETVADIVHERMAAFGAATLAELRRDMNARNGELVNHNTLLSWASYDEPAKPIARTRSQFARAAKGPPLWGKTGPDQTERDIYERLTRAIELGAPAGGSEELNPRFAELRGPYKNLINQLIDTLLTEQARIRNEARAQAVAEVRAELRADLRKQLRAAFDEADHNGEPPEGSQANSSGGAQA